MYAEIFHILCDKIEAVNRLFTFHLIPIFLYILTIDIFCVYQVFHNVSINGNIYINYNTLYYVLKNIFMQATVAHFGSTTSREPEKIIEKLAKRINGISFHDPVRLSLLDCLKQFQSRKFKFQTLFFDVDWKVILGVRKKFNFFLKHLNDLLLCCYSIDNFHHGNILDNSVSKKFYITAKVNS